MENDKQNKIIINNKEFEIIAYVNLDIGNFIVYTDNRVLEDGRVALYVNRVIKENEEIVLDEVEDDEVTQVINELKGRLENHE